MRGRARPMQYRLAYGPRLRKMDTTSVVCEEGAPRIPTAGDVVSGKYRLLRPLGEGGMGLVFEAEHLRLRQSVAIKFLRQEVLAMPDAVERFEREARASARIRGPHVVQVLDVDTDERGRPWVRTAVTPWPWASKAW